MTKVLDKYDGSTKLLVEISAGTGSICGDTFDELAFILDHNKKYLGRTLAGICFDTQHAFAAGYDLRTPEAITKVFKQFEKEIGLGFLKLVHANDSKVELGKQRDRHEHIGEGFLGVEGFTDLAQFFKKKKINVAWILETKSAKRLQDVKRLKEIKRKTA